jgi:hypothetical protein
MKKIIYAIAFFALASCSVTVTPPRLGVPLFCLDHPNDQVCQ